MNKVLQSIQNLGNLITTLMEGLGKLAFLLVLIIKASPYVIKKPQLLMRSIFFSGFGSIVIIAISGWFVGMVLGLQGYNTLERFGSVSMLGSMVALSLLRELGPVLSAILFVARAGSAMSAEIGLMKATEQLDAMDVMAVDPITRVLAPKFWSGIISVPLLTSIFNMAGIWGSYFVGVITLKLYSGTFWSQMQSSVTFHEDVLNGIIKSLVFGIATTLIALYQGYYAKPTAEGVSLATTRTVVYCALTVLFLDFVLTAFMF